MAKYIKTMVDENSDTIFPRTRANAVTMSDGSTNLETKIASKVDKTQTVNTKALSGDIVVNAVDIPNTPAGNIAATNVQAAINELDTDKVDKVTGKGLSTEDYSSDEKSKLSGIEAGAEVNNISDINATDLTDGGDTTLHTHDGRYYTETELNAGQLDNRYYTETEVDTKDALKADKLMATNLVTNGDFANGTTGWTGYKATLSIDTGRLKILANDVVGYGQAYQSYASIVGHVYYWKFTGTTGTVIPYLFTPSGGNFISSCVYTATSVSTQLKLTIGGNLGDYAFADNVLVLDLTSIFGAGLEPSKEQIDRLLSIYPNSWFNGTSEIANVKQLWNEKTDRILATNLVTNGDFSNGTTGWNVLSSTISALSNVLSVVGTGVSNYAMIYQTLSIPSSSGKKVYFKQKVRVTNANCKTIELNVDGSVAGTDQLFNIDSPVQNTWYSNSFIATQPSNVSGDIRIKLAHSYADSATAVGKVMEVQYVLALDLTKIFGAGKEPTVVQMDNLLTNFPNSWFDGTVELASLLNILATKADKTQEAWITPTLLNGATVGSVTPQYFKDQMGIVHFKGNVKIVNNTLEFIDMPVGYRMQSTSVVFPAWQFTANIYTRVTSDDGRRLKAISTTNNNVISLDAISYRAEA